MASEAATLKIAFRKTKIVVLHRGYVVFSTKTRSVSDARKFIEGWREGEASMAAERIVDAPSINL